MLVLELVCMLGLACKQGQGLACRREQGLVCKRGQVLVYRQEQGLVCMLVQVLVYRPEQELVCMLVWELVCRLEQGLVCMLVWELVCRREQGLVCMLAQVLVCMQEQVLVYRRACMKRLPAYILGIELHRHMKHQRHNLKCSNCKFRADIVIIFVTIYHPDILYKQQKIKSLPLYASTEYVTFCKRPSGS